MYKAEDGRIKPATIGHFRLQLHGFPHLDLVRDKNHISNAYLMLIYTKARHVGAGERLKSVVTFKNGSANAAITSFGELDNRILVGTKSAVGRSV